MAVVPPCSARLVASAASLAAASLAAALLAGCGPGPYLVSLFLISGDGGSSSVRPAAPVVASAEGSLDRAQLASVTSVPVVFRLTHEGSAPADVAVEWAPASSPDARRLASPDPSAPEAERGTSGLETSREGRVHTFRWDAGKDLAAHALETGRGQIALEVVVTVTPTGPAGNGIAARFGPVELANDPPQLVSATPPQAATLSGNVVFGVALSDSSGDPAFLEVAFSTDGGATFLAAARASGLVADLPTARPPGARTQDFVWASAEENGGVGRTSAREVLLRFRVRDRYGAFEEATVASGALRVLGPFLVANNQLPIVIVSEPGGQFDRTNEIPLRVTVIDAESHPVDLVVQWTFVGEDFPSLDGVLRASDVGAGLPPAGPTTIADLADRVDPPALSDITTRAGLEAALADPDMRRRLRLVMEAPVPLDGVIGLAPTRDRIRSTIFAAIGAPPRQLGRRMTFTTGPNAGLVRRIAAYDPATATATLDAPLDAIPEPGDAFVLDGRPGLQGLRSSASGFEHEAVWDSRHDLGARDVQVKLRVTPFDSEPGRAFETFPFEVRNAPFRKVLDLLSQGSLASGDLSGDGLPELVVSRIESTAEAETVAFQPTGDGQIVQTALRIPGLVDLPASPQIAPLGDAPGSRNALVLPFPPSVATEFPSVRVVTFVPRAFPNVENEVEIQRDGLRLARLGDVTGDGVADLVVVVVGVGAFDEGAILVAAGNDPGVPLFSKFDLAATFTAEAALALLVADLDGAGAAEIVVLTGQGGGRGGFQARDLVVVQRQEGVGFVVGSTPAPPEIVADFLIFPKLAAGTFGGKSPRLFVGGLFSLHRAALEADLTLTLEDLTALIPGAGNGFLGDILLTDIDSDGANDLALATIADVGAGLVNGVEIFAARPEGTPVPIGSLAAPGGGFSFDVTAGDYDGDGATDIALNQLLTIGIFAQVPRFERNPALEGTFPAAAVAAADRDGDGRTDVLVGARGQRTELRFLRQLATGELEPRALLPIEAAVEVGDLAGADGVPETLLGGEFILDAEARVVAQLSVVVPGAGIRSAAIGDWDGDGLADVVASTEGGEIVLMRQRPGGGFVGATREVLSDRPGDVAVEDLDRDGRADAVVVTSSTVEVLFSNGDAAPTAVPLPVAATGAFTLAGLAFGDVDGDGRLDVAVADFDGFPFTPVVHLAVSTGPRIFEVHPDSPLGSRLEFETVPVLGLAILDGNADGRSDVALRAIASPFIFESIGRQPLFVFLQDPTGRFASSFEVGVDPAGPLAQDLTPLLAAADLGGDGRRDLATALEGRGLGRFINHGGDSDLLLDGRIEGVGAGADLEVVVALPGRAKEAPAISRARVRADGTFRARVPAAELAALVPPVAAPPPDGDGGGDPGPPAPKLVAIPPSNGGPLPPPAAPRRIELSVVLVVAPLGAYEGGNRLPDGAVALGLVLEPREIERRLLAGLSISPISTIAAVLALRPGASVEDARDGLALARALVEGGVIAAGDPRDLRLLGELLRGAIEDAGPGAGPADLAAAFRARDTGTAFEDVAIAIEAGVLPPAPPGDFTLSPDRGPAAGGTRVRLVAPAPIPLGAGVRIGYSAIVPATRIDATTLEFVTPPAAAGAQVVALVHRGREARGRPFIYFTGAREAVFDIEPSTPLAFPPTLLGTISGSSATFTIRNPAQASQALAIARVDLIRVEDPDQGGGAPPGEPLPFAVAQPATVPALVPPGGSLTVDVRFRPRSLAPPGLVVLEVRSDDPDQPRRIVASLEAGEVLNPIVVRPERLDLGYHPVAAAEPKTGVLTLENQADGPVDVLLLDAGGGKDARAFRIEAEFPLTVPPMGIDVPVRFFPSRPGVVETRADFQLVLAPEFVAGAELAAIATGPDLLVTPGRLNLGGDEVHFPLDLGIQDPFAVSPPLTIGLQNRGTAAPGDPESGRLTISTLTVVGPFAIISGGPAPGSPIVIEAPVRTFAVPFPVPEASQFHQVEVAFTPPPLAPGVEWERHDGGLFIGDTAIRGAPPDVELFGHATTAEIAAGGGPTGPALDADAGPTDLRVRVYDAGTGQPVEGATVIVLDAATGDPVAETLTGPDGAAVVPAVPADRVDIHVGKPGEFGGPRKGSPLDEPYSYGRRSILGSAASDHAVLLPHRRFFANQTAFASGPFDFPFCSFDFRQASSYLETGLFGSEVGNFGRLSLTDPGRARVAATRLQVDAQGLACGVEPSGYGTWPNRDQFLASLPIVVADPAATQPTDGLVARGLGIRNDLPYRAFGVVEPPPGIDPATGLVVGYGEGVIGMDDAWQMGAALDPLALAPAGFPGRLRVHIQTETFLGTIPAPARSHGIRRLDPMETFFPAAVAPPIELPAVAAVVDAPSGPVPIDIVFEDRLATDGVPGYYILHLRNFGFPDRLFWSIVVPKGTGPNRAVRLVELPLPGRLGGAGPTELFIECVRLDPADPLPADDFRFHEARRRVVGRTIHGPVEFTATEPAPPP